MDFWVHATRSTVANRMVMGATVARGLRAAGPARYPHLLGIAIEWHPKHHGGHSRRGLFPAVSVVLLGRRWRGLGAPGVGGK